MFRVTKTWQRIVADPKRFGLLCTLLFIGLLLWARIIVIARPPRTAVAEPEVSPVIAAIIASDNKMIPVFLETVPEKNPFSLNSESFNLSAHKKTDNIAAAFISKGIMSERSFVESLKLEAVMAQMAMINGKVYQIGEVVVDLNVSDGLRLVEVHGRSVIISAGERRYELSIASPRR